MNIKLSCQCGRVTGMAENVDANNGTRVICSCSDCQAFAHYLGRAEVLDQYGGTDIYQTTPSQLKIDRGAEQLRCMKLSEKGIVRWYTDCCKTPLGNTLGAKFPFVGVIHSFMQHERDRTEELGPALAYVQTQSANGQPDHPNSAAKFPLGITLRIMGKMLLWKIQRKGRPTVFFNDDNTPVSIPEVLRRGA